MSVLTMKIIRMRTFVTKGTFNLIHASLRANDGVI